MWLGSVSGMVFFATVIEFRQVDGTWLVQEPGSPDDLADAARKTKARGDVAFRFVRKATCEVDDPDGGKVALVSPATVVSSAYFVGRLVSVEYVEQVRESTEGPYGRTLERLITMFNATPGARIAERIAADGRRICKLLTPDVPTNVIDENGVLVTDVVGPGPGWTPAPKGNRFQVTFGSDAPVIVATDDPELAGATITFVAEGDVSKAIEASLYTDCWNHHLGDGVYCGTCGQRRSSMAGRVRVQGVVRDGTTVRVTGDSIVLRMTLAGVDWRITLRERTLSVTKA